MKYRTRKHPVPSWWRRLTRLVRDTVDELTHNDVHPQAKLPGLDERKARVWR